MLQPQTLEAKAGRLDLTPGPRRTLTCVACSSRPNTGARATRRKVLESAAAVTAATAFANVLAVGAGAAASVKLPKGFNPVKDLNDGYQFLYPFGWQEVSVDGQDVVYKDVIEPLESVSVSLVPTDKKDVTEFGQLDEVAQTLVKSVLASPGTSTKVLSTGQREVAGINYYNLEYEVKGRSYLRHAIAAVAVANGKFYTIATGASDRRWPKMEDKLKTVIKSFQLTPASELL